VFPHHRQTVERVVEHFRSDREVAAILLVGSIAHGFAEERSDVDIALVASPASTASFRPGTGIRPKRLRVGTTI
jgi:predicted nucleotidyltransferase